MTRPRPAALAAVAVTAAVMAASHLVAAATYQAAAAVTLAGTQPNIVLLLTDDQNLAGIERMPYIQAGLATGEYINLVRAEVNNSLCCPSRGAILSGQVDTRNGVLNNDLGEALDDTTTVVAALDTAGYNTGFVGKWLNRYNAGWGRPPGWDSFEVNLDQGMYEQYNYQILNNAGKVETYGSAPEDYAVDVQTQKALTFLDGATGGEEPFFLMVAPTATHAPFVAAPRHLGTFTAADVVLPPNWSEADVSDKPQWIQQQPVVLGNGSLGTAAARADQLNAALSVDDMLRAIEDRLREAGELDNTVVVFASDNGLAQGSHRWSFKRCAYRECVSVPLLVRYPGVPGRTDTRLASNIDWAPTFLDLAGVAPLTVPDGVSLLPVLEDPTGTVVARRSILEHWMGGDHGGNWDSNKEPSPGFYAIRTLRWRYVEVTNLAVPGGVEYELYNQVRDPYELVNVAEDPAYAGRRSTLQRQLYALIAASGQTPGQPQGVWRPGALPAPGNVFIDNG